MGTINISAAICTFNRADLLGGAISSLCRQSLPAAHYEILIVDNGSTDNTADIVRGCQDNYPDHTILLISESNVGLSYARNRAMQEAKGRYLAYIDDDARAEPNWLEQALDIFQEKPEALVCLGGSVWPFYTTPKPEWFKDAYEINSWGDNARWLNSGESFNGLNMIWRKSALHFIEGFTPHLGVAGEVLNVGEETDAFHKVWCQIENPLLYYEPELRVQHWVAPYKMTVFYRLKRAFVIGQVAVKLKRETGLRWRLRSTLGGMRDLVLFSFRALRRFRRYPYWQNWLIEEGKSIIGKLGIILASMNIFVKVKQQ
jgi:glycosyltransferase involved in cell wall biosynthesis